MWRCNPYPHLCQQLDTVTVPHGCGFLQQSVFTTCGWWHPFLKNFPPNFQICFSLYSVTQYPSSRWLVSVEGSCHPCPGFLTNNLVQFLTHTEQILTCRLHPWWLKRYMETWVNVHFMQQLAYDLGEPAVSYRWTGCVGEITGWSSSVQENYRSF